MQTIQPVTSWLQSWLAFACTALSLAAIGVLLVQSGTIAELRRRHPLPQLSVIVKNAERTASAPPPGNRSEPNQSASVITGPANDSGSGKPEDKAELAEAAESPSVQRLFRAALMDPGFLNKFSVVQKQWIAEHYQKLFDQLKLDDATKERFADLLAEKQMAKGDVAAAMRDTRKDGNGSPLPVMSLIADAQKTVNQKIRDLLGADGYQAYYNFEMTNGLRATLERLQSSLAYTSEPISNSTAEAMVATLYQAEPVDHRGGIAKFTGASPIVASGIGAVPFSTPLPPNAPQILSDYLTPTQMDSLSALMKQQRDELRLMSALIASSRRVKNPLQ